MVKKHSPIEHYPQYHSATTHLPVTKMRLVKSEVPLRVAPLDFVQSLIRSEFYRKDYEALMRYKAKYEEYEAKHEEYDPGNPDKPLLHPDEEVSKYWMDLDHKKYLYDEAKYKFANRWFELKIPIPPLEALENPARYISYLKDPVVVIPPESPIFPRRELVVTESVSLASKKRKVIISHTELRAGKYCVVRIDISRPKNDILKSLSLIIDRYQQAPWALPIPLADRKTSQQKKSSSPIDRWYAWDTFNGRGERDITKTAEILYPKSFRYKSDKREMKKEADEKYKEGLAKGEKKGKLQNRLDSRINSARAAKWRIEERKRIKNYLRQLINTCERMVGTQKPHTSKKQK